MLKIINLLERTRETEHCRCTAFKIKQFTLNNNLCISKARSENVLKSNIFLKMHIEFLQLKIISHAENQFPL